jgi:hypothetical protein
MGEQRVGKKQHGGQQCDNKGKADTFYWRNKNMREVKQRIQRKMTRGQGVHKNMSTKNRKGHNEKGEWNNVQRSERGKGSSRRTTALGKGAQKKSGEQTYKQGLTQREITR